MRRTRLAALGLLALACLPLALAGPGEAAVLFQSAPAAAPPAAAADVEVALPRTVILVRHAEKETAPADPRDPGLSEAGTARAQELARLLGTSRAGHLFSSELQRTRLTLAPLAARLATTIEAVSAGKPKELVARLDALPPGSVAVVCGHSNTVPSVAQLLGVAITGLVTTQGTLMLADEAYDRVFVVTRPASGSAAVVELGYGARAGSTPSSGH